MKKLIATLGLSVALAFGGGTAAFATEGTDCVPSDAYDTVVHHDAVGTETIPNPDYVAGTPDTTTYIHHDGTPDTTEVTGYMKWNWTGGKKSQPAGPPPGDGWHQVGVTSDSKGNTPDTVIHQGNGNGSWFYFETQTKVTPGTPAWDEPVVTPGTPAIGEPTIPNPDYKAPWDETVHHDAVTCPPVDQPTPVEGWWLMPKGASDTKVLWPQTATEPGVVPCGIWAQVDTYPSQDALDKLREDGILTLGEDYGIAQSWRFVYGGDCPVVTPPDDNPPVVTPPTQPQPPAQPPVVKPAVVAPVTEVPAVTAPVVTEKLADTGSSVGYWPVGIALVLLASGGYIVWRVTRRRTA